MHSLPGQWCIGAMTLTDEQSLPLDCDRLQSRHGKNSFQPAAAVVSAKHSGIVQQRCNVSQSTMCIHIPQQYVSHPPVPLHHLLTTQIAAKLRSEVGMIVPLLYAPVICSAYL